MKDNNWFWNHLKELRTLSKNKKHQIFCDGYQTALEDAEIKVRD